MANKWIHTCIHTYRQGQTCKHTNILVSVQHNGNKVLSGLNYLCFSGLHHTKRCDDPKDSINKVKRLIKRQKPYLYHEKLTLLKMEPGAPALKPNGGWGDTRDQEMCKSFVNTDRNGLMMEMR